MNLRVLCVAACLLATTVANRSQTTRQSDEITFEILERIPVEKGAKLLQEWYQAAQANYEMIPSFLPSPSKIPVYIIKTNEQNETTNLFDFVKLAKQDNSFGDKEVTIFITGLPSTIEAVNQANDELISSYVERYNRSDEDTFSEENTSGNLIVIDLGQTLESFDHLAQLAVDETGTMIAKALIQLINDCDMSQEIIHVVAQGIAAHVAGAAGDEFTRLTSHKLRRITALDPFEILYKNDYLLSGLSRGDAEFVDAIHTSAYGIGTLSRVGDVDFYPNGPCSGVPGAENILEASMRATLYYAESVVPGNERNFPAVEANSLKQYKSNNGFGKRAFMGIDADYDLRGDYILQVNEISPFGMRTYVHQQYNYNGGF